MGNLSSSTSRPTKTVTMERSNPYASGAGAGDVTISISENLYRSLTGEQPLPKQNSSSPSSSSSSSSSSAASGGAGRKPPAKAARGAGAVAAGGAGGQDLNKLLAQARESGQMEGYYQAKQELEEVLKQQELQRQAQELEKSKLHEDRLSQELDNYLNRSVSRFSANSQGAQAQGTPCAEFQRAVIGCYKSDPTRPLDCSEVVKSFTDCAFSHRQKFIAKVADASVSGKASSA